MITAEFEDYYFVTVCKFSKCAANMTVFLVKFLATVHFCWMVIADVPNAGRKLVRLAYRQEWDVAFRNYLKGLDEKKPVIMCGDLNVAHLEIGTVIMYL